MSNFSLQFCPTLLGNGSEGEREREREGGGEEIEREFEQRA